VWWYTVLSMCAGLGGKLSAQEVSVISGAIDLRYKTAVSAMTPLSKVCACGACGARGTVIEAWGDSEGGRSLAPQQLGFSCFDAQCISAQDRRAAAHSLGLGNMCSTPPYLTDPSSPSSASDSRQ
jgi:hypothetical protein